MRHFDVFWLHQCVRKFQHLQWLNHSHHSHANFLCLSLTFLSLWIEVLCLMVAERCRRCRHTCQVSLFVSPRVSTCPLGPLGPLQLSLDFGMRDLRWSEFFFMRHCGPLCFLCRHLFHNSTAASALGISSPNTSLKAIIVILGSSSGGRYPKLKLAMENSNPNISYLEPELIRLLEITWIQFSIFTSWSSQHKLNCYRVGTNLQSPRSCHLHTKIHNH